MFAECDHGVHDGGPCTRCNRADVTHVAKAVACGRDALCWVQTAAPHLSDQCITCLIDTSNIWFCMRYPKSYCLAEEATQIEALQACDDWDCRYRVATPLTPGCQICLFSRIEGRMCLPPTCTDGLRNGDETDVDCGGSCSACGCLQEDMVHLNKAVACRGLPTCYQHRVVPFLSAHCAACAATPPALASCLPLSIAAECTRQDRAPLLALLACGETPCVEHRAAELTAQCQRCLLLNNGSEAACLPEEVCPDGRRPPCDGPAPHAIGQQCAETAQALVADGLQDCLARATEDPACPQYVMWSPARGPSPARCRCCAWGAEAGGTADAWDIYRHPADPSGPSGWRATDAAWRHRPRGPVPGAQGLTGPATGPEGGPYWYVNASGPARAVLEAAPSPSSGYAAVSFQYHMFGPEIASLALEVADAEGNWTRLWARAGPQHAASGAAWAAAAVPLPDVAPRVRFVAVATGRQSAAALAGLALTVARPPGAWAPAGQAPGWRYQRRGATPSYDTGPAQGPGDGPYWYAEASSMRPGGEAYLESPVAARGYAGLVFRYHMYGADVGALRVLTQGRDGGWVRVWSLVGQQQAGPHAPWQEVALPFRDAPRRLRIAAVAGAGHQGDVAVAGLRLVYTNAAYVTSGTCVSVARAQCEALSGYRGSEYHSAAPTGCYYSAPYGHYYWNRQDTGTAECSLKRQCVCAPGAPAYAMLDSGLTCLPSSTVDSLQDCQSAAHALGVAGPVHVDASEGAPLGCSARYTAGAWGRLVFTPGASPGQAGDARAPGVHALCRHSPCLTPGIEYHPTDPFEGGYHAESVDECLVRCGQVPLCAYFNWYKDGGCRLAPASAVARAAEAVVSGPRSCVQADPVLCGGAAAAAGGCVPEGQASYDFLFAGCPSAPGLSRVTKHALASIPLPQCQDYCTLEPTCVLVEVSGCRENPAFCGATCTLGYLGGGAPAAVRPNISAGEGCARTGDRQVFRKAGPRPWLFQTDGHFYINLPRDNWSVMSFDRGRVALVTVWDRLRLQGSPTRGATSVLVDLLDERYSRNNGQSAALPDGRRLAYKWGITGGCDGGAAAGFKVNLVGTPFRLPAAQPVVPEAISWGGWVGPGDLHGSARCGPGHRTCEGRCAASGAMACAACGLGEDFRSRLLRLEVEDRDAFDAAFPAECGPPAHPSDPHVSYAACDTTSFGQCRPQCASPYAGAIGAVCGGDGAWAYSGRCREAQAFAMGHNEFGQLGRAGAGDRTSPQPLLAPNGAPITAIAVGEQHTAFVAGGAAYALGSNQKGQLGLGVEPGPGRYDTPQPVPLPGGGGGAAPAVAVGVAAALAQTGVLLEDGRAYVMGDNQGGQLGLGRGVAAPAPTPLHPGYHVTALAMGAFHTAILTRGPDTAVLRHKCALACRSRGFCCPDFATGAAGVVSCTQACVMRQHVAGPGECRAWVAAVEAGGRCSSEAGGRAFSVCEGCNLTAGCVHDRSASAAGCSIEVRDCPRLRIAVPDGKTGCASGVYVPSLERGVEGRLVYTRFQSEDDLLRRRPHVYLYWSAQRGGAWVCDDDDDPQTVFGYVPAPTDVAVPDGQGQWWYAGQWHAHPSRMDCQQDDCFVMGHAAEGQTGHWFRTEEPRWTPWRVVAPNHEPVTALALGEVHTLFLAGGACYAMGSNAHGQLGLGTEFGKTQGPVQLQAPNGHPITAIAAGRQHSAFVAGGQLYTMGSNRFGQLGLPGVASHTATPTAVRTESPVTMIGAGGFSTAFVAGRDCFVMGLNSNGQLGLGGYATHYTPQLLAAPNGNAVTALALGSLHSAILADKTVTPSLTPSFTASRTKTATATPTLTPTPTSTASATRTLSGTATYTSTPSGSLSHTRSLTMTPTGSVTFTTSNSPTISCTPTTSSSSTRTRTGSSTPTSTASATRTLSGTATHTSTPSLSLSHTRSRTMSRTGSVTFTTSNSPTISCTPTTSSSATRTRTSSTTTTLSPSMTCTRSTTSSASRTGSPTPSSPATATLTSSPTLTRSSTASSSPQFTPTDSLTDSPSTTFSPSITSLQTPTGSSTPTSTASATRTLSATATHTSTPSLSMSHTRSLTMSRTGSVSNTVTFTTSNSPTISCTPTTSSSATRTRTSSTTTTLSPSMTCTRSTTSSASRTGSPTPSSPATATLTSSPTLTRSSTASSSPQFTPTDSLTDSPSTTCSPSITSLQTPTGSSTPTSTESATRTRSPTPTLSSLFTPTDTSSATGTATGMLTSTPSITTTGSRLFTPSDTPSASTTETPTRSAALTGSASPSPSMTSLQTPTESSTPTLSSLFTPTDTSSATGTATAMLTSTPSITTTGSRLFTPSDTPSASTTETSTRSAASTGSASPSHSRTATATPTALPTSTASVTPTPELPLCDAGGPSFNSENVQVVATGPKCVQAAQMATGSGALSTFKLLVRIRRLDGTASMRIASGCATEGDSCVHTYGPTDVGRTFLVPLSGGGGAELLWLYQPPADPAGARVARRATSRGEGPQERFSVEVVVVYTASWVTVCIVALALCLVVPPCVWLSHRHAKRKAAHPLPYEYWAKHQHRRVRLTHPRWANPWVQVALATALCVAVAGVGWYAALRLLQHPAYPSTTAARYGLLVAGAGAAGLALAALWAARDPAPPSCPECERGTSRWRFLGTPLAPPPSAPSAPPGRAHRPCVSCIVCGGPVIAEGYPGLPPGRRCHRACWASHCDAAVGSPQYAADWCGREGVTDGELAHLLAALVWRRCDEGMRALLAARPALRDHPLPGAPTILHCAAAAGNLSALEYLLGQGRGALDACAEEGGGAGESSVLIATPCGVQPDLYVRVPGVLFNGQAVHVGQSYGLYLYYYEPQSTERLPRGWCVSDYLGSGAVRTRVEVESARAHPDGDPIDALDEGLAPAPSKLWNPLKALPFHHRLQTVTCAHKGPAAPPTTDLPEVDCGVPGPPPASPASPAPAAPADARCDPAAASDEVKVLVADDLGLRRVPHTISLLDAAAMSGDAEVIERVLGMYRHRYPQCLLWQYNIGPGLWHTYNNACQREICQALKRGAPQVWGWVPWAGLSPGDNITKMQPCVMMTVVQHFLMRNTRVVMGCEQECQSLRGAL